PPLFPHSFPTRRSSDLPHTREFTPGFVYYGFRRYRDGYTNDGNILGSWIGRAGRGGQGWLTYWFSPRSTLQFGYRYQKVDRDFLDRKSTRLNSSHRTIS